MIGLQSLVALSVYAVTVGLAAPAILRRARWVVRAPRLAIALWQALSVGWVLSLILIGLTLTLPLLYQLEWPQPGQPPIAVLALIAAAGLTIATAVTVRTGYIVARELRWARRERRAHARSLALAGIPADAFDATILEHPTPAVYCLPSADRHGTVVVSSGALRVLTEPELAAVVAHERGHLRLHHHHVMAVAGALKFAFRRVPLLKHADDEIKGLAEMAADDQARHDHSPDALANALVAVATSRTPAPALGASGDKVTRRLERILEPTRPLATPSRFATGSAAASAVMVPFGFACTTVSCVVTMTGLVLS